MPEGSTGPPTGRLRAVADAGPVVHLDEVDRLEPFQLFGRLLAPQAVVDELEGRPAAPGAKRVRDEPFEVVALGGSLTGQVEALSLRHEVSLPDAATLALARSREVGLLLTDDLDLRDAAKAEGIRPVGSVGLIVRAVTEERLPAAQARASLDALLESSSLFLTPRLVTRAKEALEEG